MGIDKLPHLACRRCGHKWVPKRIPVTECPACKSYRWMFTEGEYKEYKRKAREAKLRKAIRDDMKRGVLGGFSHKGETRNVA